MMTFGLPLKQMPISLSGEVNKTFHTKWVEERKRMEEQEPVVSHSIEQVAGMPNPLDVLFGRGKFIQEHTGNQIFRQMIEDHREVYDAAMKVEKTNIAKEIVQSILDSGARFLKPSGDGWIEVTVEVAREKVSHSFRNRRVSSTTFGRGIFRDGRRCSPSGSCASPEDKPFDLTNASGPGSFGEMGINQECFVDLL
jgi:hypothetical protein